MTTQGTKNTYTIWIAALTLAVALVGYIFVAASSHGRLSEKVETNEKRIGKEEDKTSTSNKAVWREMSKLRRGIDELSINMQILLGNRYKTVDERNSEYQPEDR